MSSEKQSLKVQDLLGALEKGWKHYLSHLHKLSEEEQAHYAQQQGFPRIQDVLAHISGWWELSMERSLEVLHDHTVPIENDMDEINAEIVARYQRWSYAAVEAKFAATLSTFEHFLRDLPETALERDDIRLWLRLDAIDHYEDHRLPNAPTLKE